MGKVRHILSLSGGKDSTALAIYLRDRIPDLEYVFCDTEKELPETYEYLGRVEAYLGKPIVRLKHDGRGFDHWFTVYNKYLPSPASRWCTRHLKLQPFEQFIGGDEVVNYIGIRADEQREGYISHKPNITGRYPFKEDGITKRDVLQMLESSGLGLPAYYKWRSRSGCYFCFFQQKIEWVGLLENHRERFVEAMAYEKESTAYGERYTWSEGESLEELSRPERVEQIKAEYARRMEMERKRIQKDMPLIKVIIDYEAFDSVMEALGVDEACLVCHK